MDRADTKNGPLYRDMMRGLLFDQMTAGMVMKGPRDSTNRIDRQDTKRDPLDPKIGMNDHREPTEMIIKVDRIQQDTMTVEREECPDPEVPQVG